MIKYWDNQISINPDEAFNYLSRGESYALLGQWETAIKDYDEAIRLDPEDSESRRQRGRAYVEVDKPYKANEDYRRC